MSDIKVTYTRVHDFNVKLICAELVKKWQFETTVQIECQKWYWQGHVKNTVTYVIKFVDAINPICILSLCGPYNHKLNICERFCDGFVSHTKWSAQS